MTRIKLMLVISLLLFQGFDVLFQAGPNEPPGYDKWSGFAASKHPNWTINVSDDKMKDEPAPNDDYQRVAENLNLEVRMNPVVSQIAENVWDRKQEEIWEDIYHMDHKDLSIEEICCVTDTILQLEDEKEVKGGELICTLIFSVIVLGTTINMLGNIWEVLMENTP